MAMIMAAVVAALVAVATPAAAARGARALVALVLVNSHGYFILYSFYRNHHEKR